MKQKKKKKKKKKDIHGRGPFLERPGNFSGPKANFSNQNLASVVQTLDSAIHRINHYPAEKYYGNQLRYPLDSDLSGGQRYLTLEQPGPVE